MLTIITTPKPFIDKSGIIQRNALQSWSLIEPKPEIIAFGNAKGTDDALNGLNIKHIPDISYNEYGTPLLNSIFKQAGISAGNDFIAYVNTDIILTDSIFAALKTAQKYVLGNKFLITGRRWSIYLDRPWNFKKGDWQEGLGKFREYNGNGFMGNSGQIDYFIFPKNMDLNMPPFIFERGSWEGWLIQNAVNNEIPVLDASHFITAYHQEHFNFDPVDYDKIRTKKEREINNKLSGGFFKQYTILDSTHILTPDGLNKPFPLKKLLSTPLKIKMLFENFIMQG